jgi:5'-deoxynucleotidase YfbR-like HD superfamily hydrolase
MNAMALPGDGKQSVGDEKFAAAMRAASELTVKARSLLDQIKPYIETDDPFAAMVEAHDRAQAFEVEQETKIFLGPPNGQ